MARHRDRQQAASKLNGRFTFEKLFGIDVSRVGTMNNAPASEMFVKLLVIGDVVLVREEHG